MHWTYNNPAAATIVIVCGKVLGRTVAAAGAKAVWTYCRRVRPVLSRSIKGVDLLQAGIEVYDMLTDVKIGV
jgi:hypothetical protein